MADLAQLNNFRHTLDNVQLLISNMSDELNKVIASVNKNPQEDAIRSLFASKQIPFYENASKEVYETSAREFAEAKKWRPVTLNKVLNQINAIYEINQLREADLNKPVQKLSRRARKKLRKTNTTSDTNQENLRNNLLKHGINLGSDFSRTTILNLVQQKAKEMNWRNNTLTKNLVIINKILDSSPVVIQNKTSNWYSEMEATRIRRTENSVSESESDSDSDSDASFSRYMKASLERISKYSLSQSNVNKNFNDTAED
jgi:hypothetical protein